MAKVMMADEQALLERSIEDFFHRAGLDAKDRLECLALVERLFPGRSIAPATCQGYCSMTLFVSDDTVVQFRPQIYRLDSNISEAAREIYGSFAPVTKYIATLPRSGLMLYSMDRIEGVSY